MDTLVIGAPDDLTDALARRLHTRYGRVLRAIPADAADPERAAWLLAEARDPGLVVVVESAPYRTLHTLLPLTGAPIVLVAEQRIAAAGVPAPRRVVPRDADGLTVVPLGRAGRRWQALGARRPQPLGGERAAALVLSACGAAAASSR